MAFNFGAPAAPKPSLFGGATEPTSLFGAPQQQQAPVGGLFGSAAAPAAAPSLFGSQPAAGGLFGTPSAPPSLFGAPAPAPLGGGLFGAPPVAGGGLFGSQPTAASAPSLFGSTPAPSLFGQTPVASTSLFGAPATQPSLFGAAAQPLGGLGTTTVPTSIPLFGQSQSAASASLFGGNKSFASSSLSQPQPLQAPLPKLGDPYPFSIDPNEPTIESKIEKIKKCWDTSSTECQFQTYFYNTPVFPNTVDHYKRCENGADEQAWKKAVRENPDPERLVPALALGFPSIQKRINAQSQLAQSHLSTLSEIHTHLSTLSSQHSLTTSLRTLRAANTAAALSSRLLNVVAKISALSPNRGTGIRKEEDVLRVDLEGMKNEIESGKGRVNELWSGVGALRARRGEGGEGEIEWAVADDEGLRQILEVLAQQQAGLDHLTKTLNLASDDIEVMDEAFGLKKGSSNLSSSRGGR